MTTNLVKKWFNDGLFGRDFPITFDELSDEFNNLIPYRDNFGGSILTNWTKKPAMNVSKTEKEYIIELSVPGMSKEDIKIEINNDILTIKGKTSKTRSIDEKKWFYYSEFSYDGFERVLSLPEDTNIIDLDTIKAKHENGILMLTIPRIKEKEALKTIKEIKID